MKKVIVTINIVLIAMTSLIAGCTSGVYSYDDFVDDLRDSCASVEIGGEVTVGLFSVKGRVVRVNGELTNVLEFDDEALAEEEAAYVDSDGFGMSIIDDTGTGRNVGWSLIGQPHFYKKGRLIVFYVDVSHGSDPSTRNLLENILGSQFAGQ